MPVQILDHRGNPMASQKRRRNMVLNGPNNNIPYDSADIYGDHMADWNPLLWSADTELNMYRDRIASRVRDVARNDGWASGGLTRILDNAIGANFRPISKPDYKALQAMTGNKGFDADWAHEYGRAVEGNYRTWANDPGRYCDITRTGSVSDCGYVGFRHKLVDGDALAMMRFETKRMGIGRAPYATAVQLIDPDRLSNPYLIFDTKYRRGGVVIDDYGAATAYSIRQAHQGDWYNAAESMTWVEVPRETSWGRPVIIHNFDRERADQHRGGAGVLSPVLQKLKSLIKYDNAELDAAIINAFYAAFLESPFDHSLLADAMGDESGAISGYQEGRTAFHEERRISLNGTRIPTLYPGEKFEMTQAAHPTGNFGEFQAAVLRNIASALGISAQQLSNNWSDVNYSSARAALLEAWKTLDRRRATFAAGFFHPMYLCWLEESMETDDYPMPPGAPSFIEARGAYGKARWLGPAKGWVDPVAEKEGVWLGLEIGMSTLEDESWEQDRDWEETLDQLEVEDKGFKKRGLVRPAWMGATSPRQAGNAGGPAPIPTPSKPQKESV